MGERISSAAAAARRHSGWAFRVTVLGAALLLLLFTGALAAWYYSAQQSLLATLSTSTRSALERVVDRNGTYERYATALTRALQLPAQALAVERQSELANDLNGLPTGQVVLTQSPPWSAPFAVLRRRDAAAFTESTVRLIGRFMLINRVNFGADEDRYGLWIDESATRAVIYAAPGLLRQLERVDNQFDQVLTSTLALAQRATSGQSGSVTVPLHADPYTGREVAMQVLHLPQINGLPGGYLLTSRVISSLPLQLLPDPAAPRLQGRLVLAQAPGQHPPLAFFDTAETPHWLHQQLAQRDYVLTSATVYLKVATQGWQGVGAFALRPVLAAWWQAVWLASVLYLAAVAWLVWGVVWLRRHIVLPSLAQALEVAESDVFNRTLLATAPVGIFVCRMPGGDVLLNNATARLVLPELANAVWLNGVLNPQAQQAVRTELSVRHAQGTRHVALTQQLTRYKGANVLFCSVADISAQVQARQQIEAARRAADAANAAKSAFLASMSHEIRTPLFGLLGNLELVSRGRLQPLQREQLHQAQSSSQALLQIIDDLLDFSRIEAGQLAVVLAPLDMQALVRNTMAAYEAVAAEKGLALRMQLETGLPWVISDAARLRQILANLLANAIKFTAQGEVCVRLSSTRVGERSRLVKLSVSDTGIGIAPEAAARLFQPFSQADAATATRYGGSGLGLSICRRLAHLLDGECSLLPSAAAGSTFCLQFTAEATAAPEVKPRSITPGVFAARVLLAEDHPVNRQLLTQQLQALGCEVTAVAEGHAALQQLKSGGAWQVLISDVNMPGMGGYELARQVRLRGLQLPIIGITASLLQGEPARALQSGMTLCLPKPLLLADLSAALAQLGFASTPRPAAVTPSAALDAQRAAALADDLDGIFHALQTRNLAAVAEHAHRIRGAFLRVTGAEDLLDACCLLEDPIRQTEAFAHTQAQALESYAALWLDEQNPAMAPQVSL